MKLDFEVVIFLRIYARKKAKYDNSVVGRQMINVLARATNNAEQFCGQRKGSKFSCAYYTKF